MAGVKMSSRSQRGPAEGLPIVSASMHSGHSSREWSSPDADFTDETFDAIHPANARPRKIGQPGTTMIHRYCDGAVVLATALQCRGLQAAHALIGNCKAIRGTSSSACAAGHLGGHRRHAPIHRVDRAPEDREAAEAKAQLDMTLWWWRTGCGDRGAADRSSGSRARWRYRRRAAAAVLKTLKMDDLSVGTRLGETARCFRASNRPRRIEEQATNSHGPGPATLPAADERFHSMTSGRWSCVSRKCLAAERVLKPNKLIKIQVDVGSSS